MPIQTYNPTTEEIVRTFVELTDAEVIEKIVRAEAAFLQWKETSFAERAEKMKKLAVLLRERKRQYGELMTLEMGKPITAAMGEVEKCAWVCDYFADNAEKFLSPEVIVTDASKSYVRFDPFGIVLAVMPWNFPFWQVFRFFAPAVMAGNVGLLKHASNVPQSAMAIEAVVRDAGFPEGVFQNLLIGASKVEAIIGDARVKAVTLTGSEYAGSQVAMQAGRAIKKTVLELGGSDPFIVLDDADLSAACDAGVMARLQNAGQSCIATKRFIVVASRVEEFVTQYKARYEKIVVGDPMDEKTQMGPLATQKILDDCATQVVKSVALGAEVVIGGSRMDRKGYFYAPTILKNVKKGMPAYDEEVFGPVAAVIAVADEEEAIRTANDTPFGLGASIWTKDVARGEKLATRVEAGAVFINSMVKSDPRLPFGGIKKSGYGRELSHYGLKEFVNIKTVWVR
ncbi:MAG: NAD-dependent succinate-semialdehyde dehydrogenase [bacterium]|nr:NAD-dependent succinate-semialdehyde dehydrogenase [bacterium]